MHDVDTHFAHAADALYNRVKNQAEAVPISGGER